MITHKIALRAAWTAFVTVLIIGLMTVIALLFGAADPPRAGSLQLHTENLVYTVRQHEQHIFLQQIDLPKPPYTLEISGIFTVDSDPMSIWSISFRDDSNEILGVYLNGYQFYSVQP